MRLYAFKEEPLTRSTDQVIIETASFTLERFCKKTRLSQPTVFAFTFLLLIVMNLEQVRCTDLQFLYHSLSQKLLTMHDNGSVSTQDGHKFNQCLELDTVKPLQSGKPLVLSIYNPATGRFLCFNKNGLLVGRRRCTERCHFIETFDEAKYMEYKLATPPPGLKRQYVMAFSIDGKPQKKKNKKKTNAQIMKVSPKNGECMDGRLNETVLRHRAHSYASHHCRLSRKRAHPRSNNNNNNNNNNLNLNMNMNMSMNVNVNV